MKHVYKTVVMPFIAILLLAFSSASLAADEGNSGGDIEETMSEVLKLEKPSGEFGRYLELIFGGFIFEDIEGENGDPTYDQLIQEQTVLAEAIGFVNILAIFLGVVVTGYTMIAGTLMTAYSGEVLGKGWSTYWLPARSALGFGLLLPAKAVGAGTFSTAQLAALYLVMIGSNAGDYIWKYSVESVVGGAPIISAPKHVRSAANNKRLKALACSAALYDIRKESGDVDPTDNYLFSYVIDGEERKYYNALNNGTFSFLRGKSKLESISFGFEGRCGKQEFGSSIGDFATNTEREVENITYGSNPEDEYEILAARTGKIATVNAVINNLNGLTPAALAIIADVGEPVGPLKGVYGSEGLARAYIENDQVVIGYAKDIASYIANEAVSYSNDINTQVSEATTQNPEVRDRFTNRLTTLGWTGSYIWFHEVPKFQSISDSLINNVDSNMSEAETLKTCNGWSSSFFDFFDDDDLEDICNGADFQRVVNGVTQITAMSSRNIVSNTRDMTNIDATELAANCTKDSCENPEEIFPSISSAVVMALFSGLDHDPIGSIRENDERGTGTQQTSGLSNPFATSTAIGHNVKRIQVFGFAALVASGATAKGVSESLLGQFGGGVLDGIFTAILLPVQVALGMLAVNAMTLGYVIPIIPVLTGISLVLSYLIKVIEATVAMPLAIVQMLMPEGEGIMGTRLERSMQILATIILTPSLLVIGVIAAITVSFIGFAILNSMFWKMSSLVTGASVFEALTLVTLYTVSLIFIIRKSVGIMTTLPDSILNWFSSGIGGSFGDNAQAVEGTGDSMAQASAQSEPAARKGLRTRKARRDKAKAEKDA